MLMEGIKMNNYFIIHGSFGSPYSNWFSWLQDFITSEEKQVYTVGGVGEDGGYESVLRMAHVENGEVVEFTEDDLE